MVTDVQVQVLKATNEKFISEDATAGETMTAVAKLGGHISSNGEPGWQRLLEYEHAFALVMQAQQEK